MQTMMPNQKLTSTSDWSHSLVTAARVAPRRIPGDMSVPAEIFKAYDIRGLHGEQLGPDHAEQIGRAFTRVIARLAGKEPGELRLGLGRDMRLTAPEMAARYRAGMLAEGASVLDAGQVGTEMLYYLVGSRGLDGGIMCTASHNPKPYTGAKLVKEGAIALSGDEGIQDIRALIEEGLGATAATPGVAQEVDVYEEFQAAALRFIDPANIKPMKVVVDGGNGMAGPMVGPVLRRLPLELVETYWVPDGEFPDHEPNPLLEENRRFIVDKVVSEDADLGIAWDGDADRCFFIDDTGRFVDGDFLTAILAEHLLGKQPGADILYDARASRAVADTVEAAGGKAHINRVGHAFFKGRMRDEGAIFGGEVSGHYYFHDFYNADSGTVPALLILEKLSVEGVKLSELVERYRSRYFISGEINSEVQDGPAKMAELEERYGSMKGAKVTKVDGVSVDFEDWHFNVRPSNTEPLLRLTLESLVSEEDMVAKRDEVLRVIRS
jgi:phosphomannomutase